MRMMRMIEMLMMNAVRQAAVGMSVPADGLETRQDRVWWRMFRVEKI